MLIVVVARVGSGATLTLQIVLAGNLVTALNCPRVYICTPLRNSSHCYYSCD